MKLCDDASLLGDSDKCDHKALHNCAEDRVNEYVNTVMN